MKKLLFASLMLTTLLFSMSGCKKEDDEPKEIVITIASPTANEVIDATASADWVDLDITISGSAANKTVQDYTIKVYPMGSPADLLVDESDVADVELQFVVYSFSVAGYPSGTEFMLEVTACDEVGCSNPVLETRHFSITR